MKYFFSFLLLFSAIHLCHAQSKPDIRIAWIRAGISRPEAKAVKQYLTGTGFSFLGLSPEEVTEKFLQQHHITHVWWQKDIPGKISPAAHRAGKVLKNFVQRGGHLLLSMEAVLLLNDWEIEKNVLEVRQDTVRDEGFGRPCGFHAFLSHPVFEGLHGGAYTWKGKKDNVVRKIGFFGKHLPDTSVAAVIGIGWTYITFHEDEKLLWEYRLGKGGIMAVGAYTYFSRPNFNTAQLHRFYDNIFRYTAGDITGVRKRYWSFLPAQVLRSKARAKPLSPAPATAWKLPPFTLELTRNRGTDHFVDVAGRRILLMGKERGGIEEIWTHPFMAFRDIKTGVQMQNADTVIWLDHLTPAVTVTPEMLVRKYAFGQDTLREIITVDFNKPLAVAHYEWQTNRIRKIWVQYTSNLRLMWPYSDSCSPVLRYTWLDGINAARVSTPHAGLTSLMGFSCRPRVHLLGRYGGFNIQDNMVKGIPASARQVSGIFRFDTRDLNGKLNVYMAAGSEGDAAVLARYRRAMPSFNNLYRGASAHYNKLLNTQLVITSPDETFNEGYRWALVRSNQFLQTTPGVGTSMMAGFGTTARGWNGRQKVSGRPGYAWYFGRDGAWSAMALDACGGLEKVKDVLDMFVRYRAVTGKIFHELTSSGAVHYDAADATPLFVVLAGHYLKHSGDTAYIRQIWPAIRGAMDYCYSTDTDGDGLIENTNVGHGWIEGGPLFGTHTEFYLAGSWAAALDEAAYLAGHLGLAELQSKYQDDAAKVKQIIDRDFWSSSEKHFYNGKMTDGSYMQDETVLTAVPVYFNAVTDKEKALQTTIPFSGSRFSTDWGMRIIPENNPKYNPLAYHAGMVWPLFSGYASLAEYKTGRYVAGFTHLMDNLCEYRRGSLGSVEETLNGDVFQPAGVCSQQGWSETMVIQPAIEGMLGFFPDALSRKVSLSPCFPWDWNRVHVANIRTGNLRFNMQMQRSDGRYHYRFFMQDTGSLLLDLKPVLPPGTKIAAVSADGKSVPFTVARQHEAVQVMIAPLMLDDSLDVAVHFSGGAGVLPLVNEPAPGARNTGAKITGQQWTKDRYVITIEGKPGKAYDIDLFSLRRPGKILHGSIKQQSRHRYKIHTTIPVAAGKYGDRVITVYF